MDRVHLHEQAGGQWFVVRRFSPTVTATMTTATMTTPIIADEEAAAAVKAATAYIFAQK